jgi:hypothetical protein
MDERPVALFWQTLKVSSTQRRLRGAEPLTRQGDAARSCVLSKNGYGHAFHAIRTISTILMATTDLVHETD